MTVISVWRMGRATRSRLIFSTRRIGRPMRRERPSEPRFRAGLRLRGKARSILLAPRENGALERVLFGVEAPAARQRDPFLAGKLATLLPPGVYRFDMRPRTQKRRRWLSFCRAIASRVMSRQRPSARGFAGPRASTRPPRADSPGPSSWGAISSIRRPMTWGRRRSAQPRWNSRAHGATSRVILGEDSRPRIFRSFMRSGAPAQAPRLIEFVHGPEDALKVTFVGKGVCFDTGGLDIKP